MRIYTRADNVIEGKLVFTKLNELGLWHSAVDGYVYPTDIIFDIEAMRCGFGLGLDEDTRYFASDFIMEVQRIVAIKNITGKQGSFPVTESNSFTDSLRNSRICINNEFDIVPVLEELCSNGIRWACGASLLDQKYIGVAPYDEYYPENSLISKMLRDGYVNIYINENLRVGTDIEAKNFWPSLGNQFNYADEDITWLELKASDIVGVKPILEYQLPDIKMLF